MSAGSHRIDVAYFKLFDNCNARCNMCDCWLRPRSGRDVAYYLDVLERVLAARPRSIRFTGGEPLLLRSLPALVAAAAASGARVSVISNGRILPGKVRQLAESGCDEIVLSLDGPRQAHDRIRNTPRLFDKIMESIGCIGDARLAYGVNTVVQRETVREVPGMARLLLGQPVTPRWWHLIPVRGQPDLQPSGEDADWLGETLPGVARELAGAGVEVIADAAMFSGRATGRCEVPQFALYVDAESGRAYSCNMLAYADPPIGNLMDSAMEEIWLGTAAMAVRDSCEEGTHAACSRCDTGSMLMNHRLRSQAILAQPRQWPAKRG
jgi:MoaA/NifB/PqqE/SkfB family radical SAM enzyme